MKVREYQPVMKKLYNAAGKYPDKELADAVTEVRDLVVEYRNILICYSEKPVQNICVDCITGLYSHPGEEFFVGNSINDDEAVCDKCGEKPYDGVLYEVIFY